MKLSWWQWLPFQRWRVVGTVEAADEVPLKLPRNGAVVVGTRRLPKWIVFDCPCRAGHRIMLNIDKGRQPYWTASSEGKLTVSPSVDSRTGSRRCHYFICDGRVQWAHERTMR